MDLGIAGKTALVLGASQGIGRAIAETLAEEGANLVLVARSADALEMLAGSLSDKYGIEATPVAADLSNAAEVEILCSQVSETYRPDMLVNNAGVMGETSFLKISQADWDQVLAAYNAGPNRVKKWLQRRKQRKR